MIVGWSLTGVIATSKVVGVLFSPSETFSVIVTVPLWLAAGMTFTVLPPPDPPNTILASGTMVVLLEDAVTVNEPAAVSGSLTVNAMLPVCESSLIVLFVIVEIVGGSFTGVTTTSNVVEVVDDPSSTVIVIVVVPV